MVMTPDCGSGTRGCCSPRARDVSTGFLAVLVLNYVLALVRAAAARAVRGRARADERSLVAPVAVDVRGESYDDAAAIVGQRGLDRDREDRAADDRFGIVIEQSPMPGTEVRGGGAVTAAVAVRPTTPNVVGKEVSDAANALIQVGFRSPVNWAVDPAARATDDRHAAGSARRDRVRSGTDRNGVRRCAGPGEKKGDD